MTDAPRCPPWRGRMTARLSCALALLLASTSMACFAKDPFCVSATGLFDRGAYAEAEQVALKNARGAYKTTCLRIAGDAALMRGSDTFYRHYAQAIARDADTSLYITKGDSPLWKSLGAITVAAGIAADYGNARQGITSSHASEALDLSTGLNASLSKTIGDRDYRETIRTIEKDMRSIGRGKHGDIPVIYPNSVKVAGVSMARIVVGGQVCNAVRTGLQSFVTSKECFTVGSAAVDAIVVQGTGLAEWDLGEVSSFTIMRQHWVRADVGGRMAEVWDRNPPRMAGQGYVLSGDHQVAVTWFAEEFSKVVPFFRRCQSPELQDCRSEISNRALVWIKATDLDGWRLYGMGLPDGSVQTVHQ